MPVLATVVKEYLAQILTGKINAVFCVFAWNIWTRSFIFRWFLSVLMFDQNIRKRFIRNLAFFITSEG
jgi:hypothetical protein